MKNIKIYKPSKSVMQSVQGKSSSNWVLEYEKSAPRKIDPLMGWTSSANTLNQVKLNFASCEAAVSFAESNNCSYKILPENKRCIKPKNYSDNFKYIAV